MRLLDWNARESLRMDTESGRFSSQLLAKYRWLEEYQGRSLTEMEMARGALHESPSAKQAFFYFRDENFDELPSDLRRLQEEIVLRSEKRPACHVPHGEFPFTRGTGRLGAGRFQGNAQSGFSER